MLHSGRNGIECNTRGTIQSQQPCARFTAGSPTHVYTSAYTPDNIAILPVPLYHESDNEEMVLSATPGVTTQPSARFTAESPTHAYTPDNIAILPVPLYHVSDNEDMVLSATPGVTTQPSARFTAESPTHAYTPDNIAILPVPLYHESDNEAPTQNPFSPFPPNSPTQNSTTSSPEVNLSQETVSQATACEPTQIQPDTARIINMQCLSRYVQDITFHAATCESSVDMAHAGHPPIVLEGELHRDGLASIVCARCEGCHAFIQLETSRKIAGRGGRQRWEINLAGVWGQMSTGGGHNTLEETMAVLGVSVMSKRSFTHTERQIGEWWREELQKSMVEAGREEKQLAVARGDYHQGVPAITVVVDGGWCKRSHKHSYNALSGVGIIVGKETGKILHIGVRNKYCAGCTLSKDSETNSTTKCHVCYKNWSDSSSAMEADIILEGFQQAEGEHGVRYIRMVGDGDSSVYPTLVERVPVWGYAIKKLECANHACKCYRLVFINTLMH